MRSGRTRPPRSRTHAVAGVCSRAIDWSGDALIAEERDEGIASPALTRGRAAINPAQQLALKARDAFACPHMNAFHPRLSFLRTLCGVALLATGLTRALAADNSVTAVRTADDARVAALLAGDVPKVSAFLSDDLSYGHSNGRRDTKTEFLQSLDGAKIIYEGITYEDRQLTPLAPGLAMITARARMKLVNEGARQEFTLRILAIWREESGNWRLLAYQSARVPEPTAAANR